MISKEQVIKSLHTLPEDLRIDQIVDHLIYIEKIERGLADSKAGKVNTEEEAKIKLAKWLL